MVRFPPHMLAAYVRLLRPADWIKNVLVLAAVVFARQLTNRASVLHALIAFVAFVLLSSGFYCINDALDVNEDRQHPIKRMRPVASGEISRSSAAILGVLLIGAGIALGFAVNLTLGITCLLYIALQLIYNAWLKRVMMVDVTAVAAGFVLRAAAGAAAIGVKLSIWLALCVFFLTLYLGFIKRLCDLSTAERAGATGGADRPGSWHSVAGYDNRSELNWLLGVTAVLAIMNYLMYALSEQTRDLFGAGSIGFALLTPLVVIAIHRFYRRASLGWSDRPMEAIVRDRAVRACVLLFGAGVLVSIYVPKVQRLLDAAFFRK